MKKVMEDLDGKGNIVELLGPMGSDGQVGRSKGFDSVLAEYPDVKVIASDSADWDTAKASVRYGRIPVILGLATRFACLVAASVLVPLRTPKIRVTLSEVSEFASVRRIGIPPATAAS